jgi:Xaa-Pro dipeptidase
MPTANLQALYRDHLRVQSECAGSALDAMHCEHLVVYSGGLVTQFLDDQSYPFKANPHFKAWVPLVDNPDCFLVYTPGKRPTLVFNQPVDYWYKPASTPVEFWVEHFELRLAPTLQAARAHLPQSLAHAAFIGELPGEIAAWGFGHVNPAPLLDRLHFARAVKTPYELECMRRASAIAVRGHRAAERAFAAGESEYRTHMRYLEACAQREEEMPYNNIVAFNTNCAVLHYQHLERQAPAASARLSFLIDAGAQFNGYACDITRTYSARNDDFHHLIEAVDGAQRALCASVKPGVDYRDLHLEAHHQLATVLRDADVIRVEPDAAVSSGLSSVFFPHGVGHLLGLQVHDAGGFMRDASGGTIDKPAGHPYLRLTRRLQPGFVVTIEPGLYFIEQLLAPARGNQHARHINWARVDALHRYGGVRVEDDVAVTASGHENLTRDAFAQSAAAISSPAGS